MQATCQFLSAQKYRRITSHRSLITAKKLPIFQILRWTLAEIDSSSYSNNIHLKRHKNTKNVEKIKKKRQLPIRDITGHFWDNLPSCLLNSCRNPVDPTKWVSECVGFNISVDTHNRSFWRRVFAGNWLHWYWQPKTIKHNTTYTRNTKEKQKKTALANKTI